MYSVAWVPMDFVTEAKPSTPICWRNFCPCSARAFRVNRDWFVRRNWRDNRSPLHSIVFFFIFCFPFQFFLFFVGLFSHCSAHIHFARWSNQHVIYNTSNCQRTVVGFIIIISLLSRFITKLFLFNFYSMFCCRACCDATFSQIIIVNIFIICFVRTFFFFVFFFAQLIGLLSIYLAMVECRSSVQLSHHQHPRQRLKYRGVKKASSHKPVKSPKNIVEVFKGLPADDIEFIKQLDKQFEKFGNNIRIKIEKVNRTMAKNSKRTIDGSLGWVNATRAQSICLI